MLAISPLSNCDIERDHGGELDGSFAVAHAPPHDNEHDEFICNSEFLGGPMLEDFSFDDFSFLDFDGKDVLPDLKVDPVEVDLGEFSFDGGEEFRTAELGSRDINDECKRSSSRENEELSTTKNSPSPEVEAKRKKPTPPAKAKGSNGKRKMKVDWTPELHRRFVQAVEQLGIDKAVPSRILEIMGIDGLTRHNIASHLQKYRSHRRHFLATEEEVAAGWSHWRHMYPTVAGGPKTPRFDMNSPWPTALAPSAMGMGFPPHAPPAPMHRPFRPLHVWGHPTMDTWPRHFIPSATSPPPCLPPIPPPTSPWFLHYHPWGPNVMTQGTHCFARPVPPAMRFPPYIPPQPLYRPDTTAGHPNNKKLDSQLIDSTLPSKESIDAAIGDVLAKPRLPLPLGLKPPSLDGVLVELQKQGISKVPPPSG